MKRLLLIGNPAHAERLTEKARRVGIETSVLDGPVAKDSLIETLRATNATGAVPLCVDCIPACIEASNALRLPGMGAEWLNAGIATSILGAAQAKGVPCVQTETIAGAPAAEAAMEALGAPVWIYPCRALAAAARMRVDQMADLVLAVNKAIKMTNGAAVCLQKASEGPIYRLIGFRLNHEFMPVEIFEEALLDGAYVLPIAVSLPTALSGAVYQQMVAHATKTARILPFGCYTTEMEFVLEDGMPALAGVHVAHTVGIVHGKLLELALGIDLETDMLRIATGDLPQQSATRGLAAAGQWLTSHSGIIEAIEGVETARALPGIHEVSIRAKPGESLRHIVDRASRDRIGFVLATGGRRQDANNLLRNACNRIKIVTQPLIA